MENEIRERSVEVDGMTLTLLHKDGKWVFPLVTYYQHGLGTPLCLALLAYVEDSNEFESETVITVNLPGAERSAGCQFIDTNNNGEEVLDWLMLYGLCTPTGRYAVSGFCKYPEVDFYQSERFMKQKELCDRYFNFVDCQAGEGGHTGLPSWPCLPVSFYMDTFPVFPPFSIRLSPPEIKV